MSESVSQKRVSIGWEEKAKTLMELLNLRHQAVISEAKESDRPIMVEKNSERFIPLEDLLDLRETFPLTAPYKRDRLEFALSYIHEIREWATEHLGVAAFEEVQKP